MYRIGVDLGGTNIAVGVINEELKIVGRGKVKTKCPRPAEEIICGHRVSHQPCGQGCGHIHG